VRTVASTERNYVNSRFIRRARLGFTAALLTAAASIAVAPSAYAAPTGCSNGNEGSFSWAYCSGGSGQYQAWASCKPRYPWITNWYTSYGSWTSPQGISRAYCDGNHQVQSWGVYYR
jgi:hypothetical protein